MQNGFRNFDAVAADYDSSRYLPPEAQAQASRLIRDTAGLGAGDVLLDAGIGTGRFALPLARLGIHVIGVDISERMLAQLQAKRDAAIAEQGKLRLACVRGDLRALPLRGQAAKAVLMVHILHLITDWQQALREVRRALVPDGTLLLAWERANPAAEGSISSARTTQTRQRYFQLARERGLLHPAIGASGSDAIREYLQESGAHVEEVDTSDFHWKLSSPVSRTLAQLRSRTWSSLWEIPDADHAELMAATEAWVHQNYGSRDVTEEAEAMLYLLAARW